MSDMGGGVLNDAACYPVCASRILLQAEPIEVVANLAFGDNTGVDLRASILMKYPDNKTAFIAAGFGACFQSTYSLWGSKAIVTAKRAYAIPRDRRTSILFHADDKTSEIDVAPSDQFRLMLDDFCRELLEPGSGTFDYEEDLLAQARVMEAARLSSQEKSPVSLSELSQLSWRGGGESIK